MQGSGSEILFPRIRIRLSWKKRIRIRPEFGMKKICIAFTCSFDCNSLNSLFSFKQRIKEVPSMAIKAITLFLVCLFCLADGKGISLPQSNGLILVNIATEISAMIHPSIAQNNVFFQPEMSKLIEKQICKDKWKTKKCKRQKLRNRCKRKKVAKKCKETCQKCQKSHVLLFMKKASLTISQHFNMQNTVTCAPKSAMKIIIVALKIQVWIHSRLEIFDGHSNSWNLSHRPFRVPQSSLAVG